MLEFLEIEHNTTTFSKVTYKHSHRDTAQYLIKSKAKYIDLNDHAKVIFIDNHATLSHEKGKIKPEEHHMHWLYDIPNDGFMNMNQLRSNAFIDTHNVIHKMYPSSDRWSTLLHRDSVAYTG